MAKQKIPQGLSDFLWFAMSPFCQFQFSFVFIDFQSGFTFTSSSYRTHSLQCQDIGIFNFRQSLKNETQTYVTFYLTDQFILIRHICMFSRDFAWMQQNCRKSLKYTGNTHVLQPSESPQKYWFVFFINIWTTPTLFLILEF